MAEATLPRLAVGTRVRFKGDRRWWMLRAEDPRWAVFTRQAEFKPRGEVFYTIADREQGVRGPCDLIGQGWTFRQGSLREDAELLLRALRYHAEVREQLRAAPTGSSVALTETSTEVSHRNRVPLAVTEVEELDRG